MQFLSRILSRNNPSTYYANLPKYLNNLVVNPRLFSGDGGSSGGGGGGWDDGNVSSWSTGITKDQFDGEVVGHQVTPSTHTLSGDGGGGNEDGGGWRRGREDYETADNSPVGRMEQKLADLSNEAWQFDEMFDGWEDREEEIVDLWAQIEEPGARGSYLKDSEKAEMYKKHKEDPEVYNIERLATDYRIMRQRVMAILWLKEMEEEEEKKLEEPLDDSVELLLDAFPEFFKSHDREFHVASLPYKPDFKVMPEGWDGTTRDPDEVHYEISKKEDDMLYEEFARKFNFNKLKFKNKIKVHKYSRRRPDDGWSLTVEKLGPEGKRGPGGGWKFVSLPDGSTRPLNDLEKTFVKRETPRRRKRILP